MIRFPPFVLIVLLLLSACQPAPEERFARAQDYFENAEYRAASIELKNVLQARPDLAEARLLLARASYQLADFSTAQAEMERALAQGATGDDVWTDFGRMLLAQGDATGALERVLPNIDEASADAPTLTMLGDVYLTLNNVDEAERYYARALELAPDAAGALIGNAVIARQRGDLALAERLLDDAEARNPDSDAVWRARGNFFRVEGRPAEAAEAYQRSIALEKPTTPSAEQLLARLHQVSVLIDSEAIEMAEQKAQQLQSDYPGHPSIRFLRGRIAYANGDYQTAENELREYLAEIPRDLRGYTLLGAVSFSQNHLRQAEAYLGQAVRNNVGGNATARMLAETRLRLNKPGEALSALASDTSGVPDAALLAMYGRAQLGLGNTAQALEFFERGAAAESTSSEVALSIAAGFLAAGNDERAVDVLAAMPAYEDPEYRREALLITAYLRSGDLDEATRLGEAVLEENATDPAAYSMMGALYQAMGRSERAKHTLLKGLIIDPGHIPSLYALSRIEIIDGNIGQARARLDQILNADPAFMPALLTLAGMYVDIGTFPELLPRLQAAIDADQGSLAPRLLMIRILLLDQDAASAMRAIITARNSFPDEPRLLHAEGLANLQQGNHAAALENLKRAAALDRENSEIQYDYATISYRRGDLAGAAEALSRYRQIEPDNDRGLALEVGIQIARRNFDAARAAVNAYRDDGSRDSFITILRGDIEFAAGNAEAAANLYRQASSGDYGRDVALRLARAYQATTPSKAADTLSAWLSEAPDDTEVRRLYGQILEAQGDVAGAVAEYERLLDAGIRDPVVLNNLAWQYAQQGRDGAADLAAQAFELAPDNGSIADTYGWILFQRGEYDLALQLLKKAATLSPDNLEIQFHLAAAHAKLGDVAAASRLLDALLASSQAFPSRAEAEKLASTL